MRWSATLSNPPHPNLLVPPVQERYTIAKASFPAATWKVTCGPGPCTSWQTATIVYPGNRSLSVVFGENGFRDVGVLSDDDRGIAWKSGSSWVRYQAPATGRITVHVCPSTHMDPGWFQTADQLYEQLFKQTVTNVSAALAANPERTFLAEIAVVWAMYVGELGLPARTALSKLVADGQLEFAGGGWVQPDEAITRFEDLIAQQTLGHLWIQSVLGHRPVRVGWSADPFGHSNTMAYVSALNAYDAHLLGRSMSPHDPINSQSSVVWHPIASDPTVSTMTYDNLGYWEPYRSMRDALDPEAKSHSVEKAARMLEAYAQAAASRSPQQPRNNIVLLGDDAPLQSPWERLYPALDEVIKALNAKSDQTNIVYKYSTPSEWVKALAAEKPRGLPSRPAWDMLPLVGNEFPYWVGYYTSRSEFKQIYHDGSAYFRGASMLHALAHDDRTWWGGAAELLTLWRSLGLAQHHDIITGDCFDAVAEDNARRVRAGVGNAGRVASAAAAIVSNAAGADVGEACTNLTLTPCRALVASLESRAPATLTFFNPVAWGRSEHVSFISPSGDVAVTNGTTGEPIASQSFPFLAPDLPGNQSWHSIVFRADLPPLGTASVVITATSETTTAAAPEPPAESAGPVVLENGRLTARFTQDGTLESVTLAASGATVKVAGKVLFYKSKAGSENAWDFSTDNSVVAYEFAGSDRQAIAWSTAGPLFSEVAVTVADVVSVRYRLYANEDTLHIFTSTGPFPEDASAPYSTDALIRFETDIASGGIWWTDDNGLELQKRQRWARPFTNINYTDMATAEPVAINMYPVTSTAVLGDPTNPHKPAIALLTANSHGCTSMADGSIEFTLNRDVLKDKPLSRFTGNRRVTQHTILLVGASTAATTTAARTTSAMMSNPVQAFSGATTSGGGDPPFAPLSASFPPQIAIVSLQLLPAGFNVSDLFDAAAAIDGDASTQRPPASSGALLLRIRHIFQSTLDDPAAAKPVTIDLAAAFAPRWKVAGVEEWTVDASEPMAAAEGKRTKWPEQTPPAGADAVRQLDATAGSTVTLQPMALKTLVLKLAD